MGGRVPKLLGRSIPQMASDSYHTKAENRLTQIATYVTHEEASRIAAAAERDQRSISDWVRIVLQNHMKRKGGRA